MLHMHLQISTGKIALQLQSWKGHSWLQYFCALMQRRSKQACVFSGRGCLGLDNKEAPKYFDCLNRLTYSTDVVHKCLTIGTMFVTEHRFDHLSVVPKHRFYPHSRRHVFLPAWFQQHRNYQRNVLFPCVRSFHVCSDEQDQSESQAADQVTSGVAAAATANHELSKNHLKLLTDLLHCSTDEMKALVKRYSFFTHLSLELVREKVDIMTSFGLPYSFIVKNPRLLYQTSAEQLQKRLEQFQAHSFLQENTIINLENLPNFLECRNDYFPHAFKRLCAEKDSLEGCWDQLAYIQFRLNCSASQAKDMVNSYPLDRNINNAKVKVIFDFFLKEVGVSPEFIINHRRLLCFSVRRLQSRWKVMQAAGVTSEAGMFHTWNMSQRQFNKEYSEYLDGQAT